MTGAIGGELVTIPGAQLVASGVTQEQRAGVAEKWLRAKGTRSEHTAARYRRDITVFFRWADEHRYDVFALLPWHLSDYAADLKDGWAGDLKASTRAGRINAVSSFFRFVQQNVGNAYLPNPAQHAPRPEVDRESVTRGLDSEELKRLRNEALRRGPREYALVQLLVGSGLRISEALGADTHHLKRDGGDWYLYVKRKGKEDRTPVEVPPSAVRAVRRYLRGRKGPLFLDNAGRRMSRQSASNRIRFIALAVGIKDKSVTPHSLRHTFTTLALAKGVSLRDVQVQAGHASTETTARYDRANRMRHNPAVAAMDELIGDDLPDVEDQATHPCNTEHPDNE